MKDQELFDRLRKYTSCQASDAMDSLGIRRGGLTGIKAMEPAQKFVGRAFTVVIKPHETHADKKIEYLAHAKKGDVVMLAHGGRVDCSVWGGQRTVGARQAGAVAAVVDGAYRDVDEHREQGFPVYGREATSMSSRGNVVPVAVNEVVTMAGLKVSPGDVVFGDASGVVVIPGEQAEAVVAKTEAIAAEEADIAEQVNKGKDFSSYRASVASVR